MVNCGYLPIKHRLLDSAWMVNSGYHPLKHHPLMVVLGRWTVDIILYIIILLG